jgi:hypothetical protein
VLETARSAAGCDLLLLLQDRSSAGGGSSLTASCDACGRCEK